MKKLIAVGIASLMMTTPAVWAEDPDLTVKVIDGFLVVVSAHNLACTVSSHIRKTALAENPLRDLIETGKIKHHDLSAMGCDQALLERMIQGSRETFNMIHGTVSIEEHVLRRRHSAGEFVLRSEVVKVTLEVNGETLQLGSSRALE